MNVAHDGLRRQEGSTSYAVREAWRPTKVGTLLVAAGLLCGIVLVQHVLWSTTRDPQTVFQHIVQVMELSWVPATPVALFGLVGLLSHRRGQHEALDPIDTLVSFRIVSRGTNVPVLRETISNIERVMAALPLFPYWIELVAETRPSGLNEGAYPRLRILVVPADYRTKAGTLFKARGLHFALGASALPPRAYVVHLDEETQITFPAVASIHGAILHELRTGVLRIGQGPITFLRRSPSRFFALADMQRTGFDLAVFHLQLRLGRPLFGFRGSWLLVRNDLERSNGGLDVGPHGSVTEDAWWATRQTAAGVGFYWLSGYMTEQSPANARDMLKQRRRWLCGDLLVLLHCHVPWRHKVGLVWNTIAWLVSWLAVATFYADVLAGVSAWTPVQAAGDLSFACILTLYLVGLRANMKEENVTGPHLYPLALLLTPVFAALEGAAILYAIIRPDWGFHVIAKPAQAPDLAIKAA